MSTFGFASAPSAAWRTASPSDHGYTHIALDVTDIDAEYARLSAAGMVFNTPPRTVFGVRATYGSDPDGTSSSCRKSSMG